MRLKLASLSMVVLAVTGLSLMAHRLRQSGLGLSFSAVLSTPYTTSTQFLAMYGLVNSFVLCMAWVFAPPATDRPGGRGWGGELGAGVFSPLLFDSLSARSYGRRWRGGEGRGGEGRAGDITSWRLPVVELRT